MQKLDELGQSLSMTVAVRGRGRSWGGGEEIGVMAQTAGSDTDMAAVPRLRSSDGGERGTGEHNDAAAGQPNR